MRVWRFLLGACPKAHTAPTRVLHERQAMHPLLQRTAGSRQHAQVLVVVARRSGSHSPRGQHHHRAAAQATIGAASSGAATPAKCVAQRCGRVTTGVLRCGGLACVVLVVPPGGLLGRQPYAATLCMQCCCGGNSLGCSWLHRQRKGLAPRHPHPQHRTTQQQCSKHFKRGAERRLCTHTHTKKHITRMRPAASCSDGLRHRQPRDHSNDNSNRPAICRTRQCGQAHAPIGHTYSTGVTGVGQAVVYTSGPGQCVCVVWCAGNRAVTRSQAHCGCSVKQGAARRWQRVHTHTRRRWCVAMHGCKHTAHQAADEEAQCWPRSKARARAQTHSRTHRRHTRRVARWGGKSCTQAGPQPCKCRSLSTNTHVHAGPQMSRYKECARPPRPLPCAQAFTLPATWGAGAHTTGAASGPRPPSTNTRAPATRHTPRHKACARGMVHTRHTMPARASTGRAPSHQSGAVV
jgi:hypothetical protein